MGSGSRMPRWYKSTGLALAFSSALIGCSSGPIYTEPQRVVYVPVRQDLPVERPAPQLPVRPERSGEPSPKNCYSQPAPESTYIDLVEHIEWETHLTLDNDKPRKGRRGSRRELISDMKTLSLLVDREGAWFEFPQSESCVYAGEPMSTDDASKISKAYGLPDERAGAAINMDGMYLYRVFGKNKGKLTDATAWHIHPKRVEDKWSKDAVGDGNSTPEERSARFRNSMLLAMPSKMDLVVAGRTIAWAAWPSNGGVNYSHGVCSPYGAFIISLTPEGKQRFGDMNVEKVTEHVTSLWKGVEELTRLPDRLKAEPAGSVSEHRKRALRTAAGRMTTEYYTASFIGN